jgi:hypothetical protein
MKRIPMLATLASAQASVGARATPTPAQEASKDCAALRTKIGATAFARAFATSGTSNAFGRCV